MASVVQGKHKRFVTMEQKDEEKTCCICGMKFTGYGYNPYPIKESGECCRQCNYEVVVPERYRRHLEYQKSKENE
jgi:hypothetical protein